jgi:hypothetical protein
MWIEEVKQQRAVTKTTKGGKTTTTTKEEVVGWGLTEAGRKYLAEADDLKPLLESLVAVVSKLPAPVPPPPPPDPTAFRAAIQHAAPPFGTAIEKATEEITRSVATVIGKAFSDLQKTVGTALGNLEQAVVAALPPPVPATTAPQVDALMVLATIRSAVERIQAPAIPPPVAPSPAPPPLGPLQALPSSGELGDEIVRFVGEWSRGRPTGPSFEVVWKHLRAQNPDLSVSTFQDVLRKLDEARRIKLGVWSQSIPDLPEPEIALFVSHKVMYYAHPAD